MSKISPILKAQYANNVDPNELLNKGLITPQEVDILTRKDETSMAWLDKWWITAIKFDPKKSMFTFQNQNILS